MRNKFPEEREKGRMSFKGFESPPGELFGAFAFNLKGAQLRIISSGSVPNPKSDIERWEHVSVSHPKRCPTWDEMCFVKGLFWEPEECVIQFHPPESEYINQHPFCLHLWKKVGENLETPQEITI